MPKTRSQPELRGSQPAKSDKPVQTLRHRSIKASIWRNSTAKGPVYNVTLVRGYRDDEGWKESHSFGYDDLPVVAKLLNDCHSFITSLRERDAVANRRTSARPEKQAG